MSIEIMILVLLILGLSFMVLEAFMPAFGLLGLGGIVSFVAALIMLNDQSHFYGMPVNMPLMIALGLIGLVILGVSAYFTVRTFKTRIQAGAEIMHGMQARVVEWHGTSGRVHIDGETWLAQGPEGLVIGDAVVIEARENLVLHVRKDS